MTEYKCELCNFKTKLKSNFKRHTLTIKHKKNIGNINPELLAEKICVIAPSKTLNFIENIKKKDQNSLKNPHFPSKIPHFPSFLDNKKMTAFTVGNVLNVKII